jgi:thioredoxin
MTEIDGPQLETALKNPGVLVVDCYAPWCPDCRAIAPVLGQLAAENAGHITFAAINVDTHPAVKEAYSILAVPTLLIFKDGKLLDRWVEPAPRKKQLREKLDRLLA